MFSFKCHSSCHSNQNYRPLTTESPSFLSFVHFLFQVNRFSFRLFNLDSCVSPLSNCSTVETSEQFKRFEIYEPTTSIVSSLFSCHLLLLLSLILLSFPFCRTHLKTFLLLWVLYMHGMQLNAIYPKRVVCRERERERERERGEREYIM